MKKQRRPCTTQVLTQMWVPPQSNSVSYRVAPSSGDCRKKSYLHQKAPEPMFSPLTQQQALDNALHADIAVHVMLFLRQCEEQDLRAYLGRITSTWWPSSWTALPRAVTTSPRPPTLQMGAISTVTCTTCSPGGVSCTHTGKIIETLSLHFISLLYASVTQSSITACIQSSQCCIHSFPLFLAPAWYKTRSVSLTSDPSTGR